MIARRVQQIKPSATLSITAKANSMRKEGIDVISFGAGEPDFDTPSLIKKAAIEAIEQGFTKYTPTAGILKLRQAICEKLKRDNNLSYSPDNILVSNGAKQCLYNIILALVNPYDEVLIPIPYWVSYEEMVHLAEGKCVFLPTKDFKVDAKTIEEYVSPRTKALILNSPSNPTGAVYDKKELLAIADVCLKNDIFIISDEIYEKLIYGKKHYSIASFGEEIKKLSIVVNGVSKTYAMTGWRIGYCAADEEIIKAATTIQDHTTSNPNSIAQKAALTAINGSDASVQTMRREYRKRRDFMVERLNSMKGVKAQTPDGAFYVFADISGLFTHTRIDSAVFCEKLLTKARVAAIPGSAFGDDRYIRLSFATSMKNIREGLNRIAMFIDTL